MALLVSAVAVLDEYVGAADTVYYYSVYYVDGGGAAAVGPLVGKSTEAE